MSNKKTRKLFTTIPGLTLLYGLPFGLFMYVTSGTSLGALVGGVIAGLFFGITMAYFTRNKNEANFDFAERVNVRKSKQLNTYLKQGVAPTDQNEIEKLKKYMSLHEKRYEELNARYYPKKYSKLATYVLISVLFMVTITVLSNYKWIAVVYPIVLVIGLYGEYRQRTLMKQIKIMRQMLLKNNTKS